MRTRRVTMLRWFGPVLVTPAALMSISPPVAAAPQVAIEPHIDAVSLSTSSVTVSGMALAQVRVTVTVTGWPEDVHRVRLDKFAGSAFDTLEPSEMFVVLERVSGSPGSGTYDGTAYVPSTADGPWLVFEVSTAQDLDSEFARTTTTRTTYDDGLPDTVLTVHGTHRPRLRASLTPKIVPYPQTRYTADALFDDRDTGQPLAGYPVVIEVRDGCKGIAPWGVTDHHGHVRRIFDDPRGGMICAWAPLPVPPATAVWQSDYASAFPMGPTFSVLLGARPASPRVRLGSSTVIDGKVLAVGGTRTRAGAVGTKVVLQRLVGRTWRTVNSARVTPSGRYHLVATPPHRGRNVYHVQFPSQDRFAGTVTRRFPISAQ